MKQNIITSIAIAIITFTFGFSCITLAYEQKAIPENEQASSWKLEIKHHEDTPENNWQFEFSPYLWMAGLSGKAQIGNLPASTVDAEPSDILKALNFGIMGALEARKDRFGILADAMYINLSQSLPSDKFGQANAKINQQMYSLAGIYNLTPWRLIPIDIIAGARYLTLKLDLSAEPNTELGFPNGLSVNGKEGWFDGFIGARAFFPITNNCKLIGYADVGTGGSKMSWQTFAGLNYAFTQDVIGKLGYRIISENYDKNKVLYDMRMGGFYLGLGMRF